MTEQRKSHRVVFERGHPTQMMAIDGTWRRDCIMEDVSEGGAKLTVEGSVEGLHLKELFLLLSSTGLAYRRCAMVWVNGDQIGVISLSEAPRSEAPRPRRTLAADLWDKGPRSKAPYLSPLCQDAIRDYVRVAWRLSARNAPLFIWDQCPVIRSGLPCFAFFARRVFDRLKPKLAGVL